MGSSIGWVVVTACGAVKPRSSSDERKMAPILPSENRNKIERNVRDT